MTTQRITIAGKSYTITTRHDGERVITCTWDAIIPSTATSVRPKFTRRSATIDPSGRLGRKILAAA